MSNLKVTLSILGVILATIILSFALGWTDVFYTKTVGKAKQNAETEVYYETQAFTDGKKREALKLYQEYKKADPEDRPAIKQLVSHSFANFDESKLSPPLDEFVRSCKYE